jgi:uroporphyrin-III C-methyltransferase
MISFVGAGPGDPELMTLKGLSRLRDADVVIHDRLIPQALLREIRPDAERIDVGKTVGGTTITQERINALIVDRGRRGRRVVRLKGGDPAVFGRMNEELRAVRAADLAFEIVPGVTAASAAAAAVGTSLTERGCASMVVLATGTDQTGRDTAALDWNALATIDATLVFYMPVRRLASITTTLVALGRDPREPALVIASASTRDERIIAAELSTIHDAVRDAAIDAPAIFVTGAAVAAAHRARGVVAARTFAAHAATMVI